MSKDNTLEPGSPRLGWFIDGLPDEVTPHTATMLVDDGNKITLHVPWRTDKEDSYKQFKEWFSSGFFSTQEPDTDDAPSAEDMPQEILFEDFKGGASLIGCTLVGFNSRGLMYVGAGRIDVQAVVLGARKFGYTQVNGMRTQIPGIQAWLGVRSVEQSSTKNKDGMLESVSTTVSRKERIPLSRKLGLALVPGWEVSSNSIEGVTIRDYVDLETRVVDPTDWEEHLELHGRFRDLVRVSTWEPVGYRQVRVLRDDDRPTGPDGSPQDKWRNLKSYSIVGFNSKRVQPKKSLFVYSELGPDGFDKWLNLYERFSRGFNPLLSLVNSDKLMMEMQFSQAVIGLEAIALETGKEENVSGGDYEPIHSRLGRLQAEVPVKFLDENWAGECAEFYNGVKHANKTMPAPELIWIKYIQVVTLFRIWVANRLGIPSDLIKERIMRDGHLKMLVDEGATAPLEDW